MRNTILLILILFIVALVPRVVPSRQVTNDETFIWHRRAYQLREALITGELERMVQAYHPGVTTMWLGAAGLQLRDALDGGEKLRWYHYRDHLTVIHLPFAVVNAACIVFGFFLLRRLFGGPIALLGSLFWMFDPFILTNHRLIHVDGLITTFMFLAFLAGLIGFRFDSDERGVPLNWRWLAISGVFSGLAVLTRFTALYGIAVLGLSAFFLAPGGPMVIWRRVRTYAGVAAVLLGLVIAVWLVLYPATLTDFAAVYERQSYAFDLASRPNATGNYFLGQLDPAPDWRYFPVVLAVKLTPWAMLGMVALSVLLIIKPAAVANKRGLLLMALYGGLYLALMDVQNKVFPRYGVPAFPAFDILGAAGLVLAVRAFSRWRNLQLQPLAAPLAFSLVGLMLVVHTLYYHPYYDAHFNQLLGGARAGTHAVLVGRGEAWDVIATEFEASYGCGHDVAMVGHYIAQPHMACQTVIREDAMTAYDEADFVVYYIKNYQRDHLRDMMTALDNPLPDMTVTIHGIDYAYIYDLRNLVIAAD